MKTVLITGSTSGIGHQLARDYADSGWQVVACGRNGAALAELGRYSPHMYTLCFDVTDYQQTQEALQTLPVVPELWILNAGDCEYLDNGKMDARLFQRIMNVNVVGMANCIEAFQPYFSAGQTLVMVGSVASEVALPRAEAYGASKAAVSYLARSLAVDLQPQGIRVVCAYPGFVATPLTEKNTFSMPMLISVQQASAALRKQIRQGKRSIYFPARFTALLRLISLLPYAWQVKLAGRLTTK